MAENLKAEYGSDVLVDLLKALDVEYVALNPGASFRPALEKAIRHVKEKKELALVDVVSQPR